MLFKSRDFVETQLTLSRWNIHYLEGYSHVLINIHQDHFTIELSGPLIMKAVNYIGPYKVQVEEVEKPTLEHPDDIIVKVTTVRSPNICSTLRGSD